MRTFVDVQEMTNTMPCSMPVNPNLVYEGKGATFSLPEVCEKWISLAERGRLSTNRRFTQSILPQRSTGKRIASTTVSKNPTHENGSSVGLQDIPSRASWENRSIDRYVPLQHTCECPLLFVCGRAKVLDRSYKGIIRQKGNQGKAQELTHVLVTSVVPSKNCPDLHRESNVLR